MQVQVSQDRGNGGKRSLSVLNIPTSQFALSLRVAQAAIQKEVYVLLKQTVDNNKLMTAKKVTMKTPRRCRADVNGTISGFWV